ncbi:PREDICTED: uncharacterized protein LOC109221819 [Nicotiana attenuata]|uniref:uncharacterized protein LOC109221819 n=1 Tax=Nicotiana attenuata TaxID=49451 RepID=UPI0009051E45|nr:PREDICTED: uncharacterized protein LOC109221819 [Nicotiana attenuata]
MSLSYIPPLLIDGEPVVQLDKAEVEEEEAKWKCALIAYILGDGLGYKAMQRYISIHWSHVPEPDLFYHKEGYYIIRFKNMEDPREILCAGPYSIASKPIILKPWTLDFDFSKELPISIPLWEKFPKLPMSCWGMRSLSRIASVIGKPIFADECTTKQTRVSYARMLIEVNVTKELPSEVWVMEPNDKKFLQSVSFDWKPAYCEKCLVVGHRCEAQIKTGVQGPPKKGRITQEWRTKVSAPTVEKQEIQQGNNIKIVETQQPKEKVQPTCDHNIIGKGDSGPRMAELQQTKEKAQPMADNDNTGKED